MIPEHIVSRKGPRSTKDLQPEVLEYLNKGEIETANLIEWLAVNQLQLLKKVLEDINKSDWYDIFHEAVVAQKKPSANSTTKVIGTTFLELTEDKKVLDHLTNHTSDVPRCWAAYWAGISKPNITQKLKAIEPFAADSHFGVREVAIFATKEAIIDDLDTAIQILSSWTSNSDENIRRYAIEATRPIGVWTKKIDTLKENPNKGLPILEPLMADASKYVRDATGNWLNDVSKSKPDWVIQICKKWERNSPTKETQYIIKRGLRSINK